MSVANRAKGWIAEYQRVSVWLPDAKRHPKLYLLSPMHPQDRQHSGEIVCLCRAWYGELIAAGVHGEPDFLALLHGRHVPTCVYAFDLFGAAGPQSSRSSTRATARATASFAGPCQKRSAALQRKLPDSDTLQAERSRRGLEGLVAKRKDAPHRSPTRSGWVRVKTSEWSADNR